LQNRQAQRRIVRDLQREKAQAEAGLTKFGFGSKARNFKLLPTL
jgi:hypothetical protein